MTSHEFKARVYVCDVTNLILALVAFDLVERRPQDDGLVVLVVLVVAC